MGRFTINLPGNRKADVQWGIVRKNKNILSIFKRIRKDEEHKIGYVVKLDSDLEKFNEYHLFKTKDEQWSLDADGRIPLVANNYSLTIQQAIFEYESTARVESNPAK